MKNDSQAGFSLIELMVVCGIVGILISICLGHYDYFKNSAFDSEAENYVRHTIKLARSMDVDNQDSTMNFELAHNSVVLDDSNLIIHFPKLYKDPNGIYILINKNGPDLAITSFHCHGHHKYQYDAATGEFVIQKTDLTDVERNDKCTI